MLHRKLDSSPELIGDKWIGPAILYIIKDPLITLAGWVRLLDV